MVICAVVVGIGLPTTMRNMTAMALVIAWLVPNVLLLWTGDNLPLRLYFMADIAVIAAILAKGVVRAGPNPWPAMTPWDCAIVLSFMLGCWPLYVAQVDPWWKWMALWGLSIAQFMLAGAEATLTWRKRRHEPKPSADIIPFTPHFAFRARFDAQLTRAGINGH
jgi:hypothetical protein